MNNQKMKQLQTDFMKKRAAYDAAFEAQEWELVESLEDSYLDAEFALFDGLAAYLTETGQMNAEDLELIRRKSYGRQWDRVLEMATSIAI